MEKYKKSEHTGEEGKTVDECLEEIFSTVKNEGNQVAWRIKKSRFNAGTLPDHGKKALLEEFGYILVAEAKYVKAEDKK